MILLVVYLCVYVMVKAIKHMNYVPNYVSSGKSYKFNWLCTYLEENYMKFDVRPVTS